jgi:nucleoside-diphosphate-sugar epimerase
MMYMPDALQAAMALMEADSTTLRHRNAYNVTAMSVAPQDIAAAIRTALPHFTITYAVDPVRQAIADSWPRHLDDTVARTEWGWCPRFDLAATTQDMLEKLVRKFATAAGEEPCRCRNWNPCSRPHSTPCAVMGH